MANYDNDYLAHYLHRSIVGGPEDANPNLSDVVTHKKIYTQTYKYISASYQMLILCVDGVDTYRLPYYERDTKGAWWQDGGHYTFGPEDDGTRWVTPPSLGLNNSSSYRNDYFNSQVRTDPISWASWAQIKEHPISGEWLTFVEPYYHIYLVKGIRAIDGYLTTTEGVHVPVYIFGEYIETPTTTSPDERADAEISAVNRSGTMYNVNWRIGSEATSPYNTARITSLVVRVSIGILYGNSSTGYVEHKYIREEWPLDSTSYSFSLDDVLDGMTREDFFPYTDKCITTAEFYLLGRNHFGAREIGYTQIDVASPDLPTIDNFEYDSSTGIASATITAPFNVNEKKKKSSSAVDLTECVGMDYSTEVIYSRTRTQSQSSSLTRTYDSSVTVSSDAVQKGSLTFGDYIEVAISARSLGIAGRSAFVKKSIYVSYPAQPIVSSAIVPSTDVSDNVIVNITLSNDAYHPTTNVKLQKLVDVTYVTPDDIPIDANWQDTDSEDNRECTALSIPIADVYPQRGRKVWLRVKAWNMDEELCRYSAPVRLTKLERPERTAADDYITIASAQAYKDGTSAKVKLAWDRSGRDDSNRTEISWSTNEVAWKSTEGPSTFDMPDDVWKEGGTHVSFDNTGSYWYNASATVYLSDLEEGKQYYVKARRVRDPEDDDANGVTYGPYSSVATVTPYAIPETVTADIPEVVAFGEPVHVDWGYTGTSKQTSWMVTIGVLESGTSKYFIDRVLASGDDATTSCDIPWSAFDKYLWTGGTYFMRVWVSTGGSYATSDHKKVRFAKRPTLIRPSVASPAYTIWTQPVRIAMMCTEKADLTITITARNATRLFPYGARQQVAGDTIWSGKVSPFWQNCNVVNRMQWEDELEEAEDDFNAAMSAHGQYIQQVINATEDIEDAKQAVNDAYDAFPVAPNRDDYDSDSAYEAAMDQYRSDYETAMENLQEAQDAVQDAYDARAAIDPNNTPKLYETAISEYYKARVNSAFDDVQDNDKYVAVVELDEAFDLVNMSTYDVSITATSTETGLMSDEVNFCMLTDYSFHFAPNPEEYVTVEPYESTDNNMKTIGARIHLPFFPRLFPNDVYDVYRMANGKAVLIAEGVSQGSTVNDPYSPYGGATTAYRVAVRTPAKSLNWFDFPYEHSRRMATDGRMLRLDWDGKYVELTHCVTNSDSYQKDFEATKHLDGSVAGHWNTGTMRTASFSATVIDVYEADTLDLLRDLAAYDGPCFVRTSDGIAYEADVEVGDISESYGKASVTVSFTASEVDLTSEYMAGVE